MEGIFRGVRTIANNERGRIDFEDMLGLAVELYRDSDREPRPRCASGSQAFTVDEYQDVNPLQQALLDAWLGDRDELCVVGDDYQTIYSFTGASPEHLLGFPDRYPDATVVRLEENYRSSPQILTVANALARSLGGFDKTLRATRAGRAEPHRAGARRPGGRDRVRGRRRSRGWPPWGWRWSRWPCCTASTPGPSPSRKRSPPPASPTRCVTGPSCADPDREP